MKNLIKSRRGIAIEMAVGAMFIMIALSIVLISVSNMQIDHRDNDLDEFNEKIELYEITDKILSGTVTNGTEIETSSGSKFTINIVENKYDVIDFEGKVVLTLTVSDGKITSWGN